MRSDGAGRESDDNSGVISLEELDPKINALITGWKKFLEESQWKGNMVKAWKEWSAGERCQNTLRGEFAPTGRAMIRTFCSRLRVYYEYWLATCMSKWCSVPPELSRHGILARGFHSAPCL